MTSCIRYCAKHVLLQLVRKEGKYALLSRGMFYDINFIYRGCLAHKHRNEVKSEAGYYYPEYADECHESPNVLQLHAYYSKSRDHIKRLDEVGALVTIYECVQAVEQVSTFDTIYSTNDQRTLNCELSTL